MEDRFDGSRKDSLRLQLVGWGDKLSEIFNAAIELGSFAKVSAGTETIPAIAEALDILPLNAERLVRPVQQRAGRGAASGRGPEELPGPVVSMVAGKGPSRVVGGGRSMRRCSACTRRSWAARAGPIRSLTSRAI